MGWSISPDFALIGANPNPTIIKEGKTEYFENYYLAHCPNGIHNVASFTKITYQNIYPNIDWVIYTKGQEMKYDFVVHPGGNSDMIQVRYKDAEGLKIAEDGSLLVSTRLGEVIDQKPVSFQNGKNVVSRFNLSNSVVTYKIEEYNKSMDLVIDPGLIWSTYYGGSGDEIANNFNAQSNAQYNIAIDNNGFLYMSGTTTSNNGIAQGGFSNTYTSSNPTAMLIKFDLNGNRLWGTYFGGQACWGKGGVAVDNSGNVIFSGQTGGDPSIPFNAFQSTQAGSSDAFLAKFSSSGSRLWSTYYGGSAYDYATSVAVDASNNIYMTGITESTSGIAQGGNQIIYGGGTNDAFLVKFSSSGSRLWSTYIGGSGYETVSESSNYLATDFNGNVYVTGRTTSTNSISSGGFQNTISGSYDGFLIKYNSNGNKIWGTYTGTSAYLSTSRSGTGITTDNNGDIYIVGSAACNCSGFILKVNSNCTKLWETYPFYDVIDVTTDLNGNVYIAGATSDTTHLSGGYQTTNGGGVDAIIAKYTSSGTQVGSTYFGGTNLDLSQGIVTDNTGNLYLCGNTASTTNISYLGFQNNYGGGTEIPTFTRTENIRI